MVSAHNLLKPASGDPVMTPDKDVVVGCYYITKIREGLKGEGKIFASADEAIMAYNNRLVSIQSKIKTLLHSGEIIETSVGRLIFNKILPEELGFKNEAFDKKRLQALVREVYRLQGTQRTAQLIDEIKRLGFTYMKQSGLSWGMDDLLVPKDKYDILKIADEEVLGTYEQYQHGLLTEEERKNRVVEIWAEVSEKISKSVSQTVIDASPVHYMVSSGARGSLPRLPKCQA